VWPLVNIQGHYDGNNSDSDDPFVDSDHEHSLSSVTAALLDSPSPSQARPGPLRRAATIPRRTPRTRPALPASYSLPVTRLQQRGSHAVSLRHLDRFIPARHQGTELSERFKANKSPQELTALERILRHSGATEDPFVYRRRVVTPLGSETRSWTRAETAASQNDGEQTIAGSSNRDADAALVGSVLGPLDQNSVDGNDRPTDGNSAWTVGLGGTAVNNGRGQLVRSRTNARLFRTTFPSAKPHDDEEQEKHKARIAAALGLDRAHRVLETNMATPGVTNCKKPGYVRTQWNGAGWVNDGPIPKPQRPLGNQTLPTAPFK